MPSKRLQNNKSVQINLYDVIGQDGPFKRNFITHVGLAQKAITIDGKGKLCDVVHTRPPSRSKDISSERIKFAKCLYVIILIEAYPDYMEWLKNKNGRRRFGLEGDGPWPILLCGYLFHALEREAEEIRAMGYKPRSGDEFFPRG